MIQVTIAEAENRLPELLALVETGEGVEIRPDSGGSFVLVHKPRHYDDNAPAWPGYPGGAEGCDWLVYDDFDEPLEDSGST